MMTKENTWEFTNPILVIERWASGRITSLVLTLQDKFQRGFKTAQQGYPTANLKLHQRVLLLAVADLMLTKVTRIRGKKFTSRKTFMQWPISDTIKK